MALLHDATFEGASLTGANGCTSVSGTVTLDNTSKVKGTYSAFYNTAVGYTRFDFAAEAEVYVSAYLYMTTVANSVRTIFIQNGLRLDIRSNRALRLSDAGGTQIGSDSGVLALNTLYRVGVHYKQGTGSNGIAEAFVTATGSPDAAFGAAFAQTLTHTPIVTTTRVDAGNTAGATANSFYLDDIKIDDASMPPPSTGASTIDTNYTAAGVLASIINNNYTAAGVLQALINSNYTAAGVISSIKLNTYTAAGQINVSPITQYTALGVLTGTPTTSYTARGVLQGTVVSQYTAAGRLAIVNAVNYTAAGVLSGSPITAYTAAGVLTGTIIAPYYPWLVENPWSETSFWLCDQFGNLRAILEGSYYLSASYQLGLNSITSLQLELPGDFPYEMILKDAWIYPVRNIQGRAPIIDSNVIFFVQQRSKRQGDAGQSVVGLKAVSGLELAKRRLVAYDAETAEADKSGFADDLIRDYFRENYGGAAGAGRDASQYLSIPDDMSMAANVDYAGSRKDLLSVLTDLGTASGNSGVPLYYDLVLKSPLLRQLVLRTWTHHRGADRRRIGGSGDVMLTSETGAIGNISLIEDWSKGWNFVYATGKGQTQQRIIKTAEDAGEADFGPFSLIETQINANNAQSELQVQSTADARLRQGRPSKAFSADVIDTALYGQRFFFGDLVNAETEGSVFDVLVSGVSVSCRGSGDEVKVLLRAR